MTTIAHERERGGHSAQIDIENVNLSFGANRVLREVTLRILPGEFFAFLGPSGCGKTTLLRLIAGFNRADSGRVLISSKDVSGLPPWRRDVGMVFQSYALWPHMTVDQNVAFGLEERGIARKEIARRVTAALDLVDLRALAGRRPSQLSGGQQQRVALARTIIIEPKVLLLDEPLSNLDAKLRVQVRRELRDLQQRLGTTSIFVTHDQEEANTICDRIAVMNEGTIQQVGTPMELYDHPANLFVAGFLGTANILEGCLRTGGSTQAFEMAAGTVPLPAGCRPPPGSKLMFRPQNAQLSGESDPLPSGYARLNGVVHYREFIGAVVRYSIRLGTSDVLVDVTHRSGQDGPDNGSSVAVDVAVDKLLFLAR